MGITDGLKALLAPREAKQFAAFGFISTGGAPIFKEWNADRAMSVGLKQSGWVYAALRYHVRAVSPVPMFAQVKQGDEWVRDDEHPLSILLSEPNPQMSGQDLRERWIYHLYLAGNAVNELISVRSVPFEMWPLLPQAVTPIPDMEGHLNGYQYSDPFGRVRRLDPLDVAHLQFVDPQNPLWGLAPLQPVARVVDSDIEAVKWNRNSMAKRARKDLVFYPAEALSRQQWEEAREQSRTQIEGGDNAGGVLIASTPGKFEGLNFSPVEMDFIASRQMTRAETLAALDMRTVLLTGEGTFRNYQEARRAQWQDVYVQLLEDICLGLTDELAPFWDRRRRGEPRSVRVWYDVANVPALQEDFTEKLFHARQLADLGFSLADINARLDLGFEDVPDVTPRQFDRFMAHMDHEKITVKSADQRAAYWKEMVAGLERWEDRFADELDSLFRAEGERVARAYAQGQEAALRAISEDEWADLFHVFYEEIIGAYGQEAADQLLRGMSSTSPEGRKDFVFNPQALFVQSWINRWAVEKVTEITDTTREALRQVVGQGIAEGQTSPEIARSIRGMYGHWTDETMDVRRSLMIARTESGSAANYAQQAAAEAVQSETGLRIEKTWVSSRDDRVRDSHWLVDGETVPLDQPFSNGLMQPGDPDGSAADVINCRCVSSRQVFRG